METKHTPGPWIEDDGGWITSESRADVVKYEGCGSHKAEWENPSDKVLVMAAPDLLEALIECAERLHVHMKHSEDLVAHMKACAAIAKATA